jgi:hypothetical protein
METIPLCEKLEIKDGYRIKLINEPESFLTLLDGSKKNISILKKLSGHVDLIHLFTKSKKELSVELPALKNYLKDDGIFWVSWPSQTSKTISDLDDEAVKQIGIKNGFSVSKICSINIDWSALKFVYRKGSAA